MLRFLSNYIFQNENEPEPNENPTTAVAPTPSSAPKSETTEDSVSGRRRKSDELMEYDVKPEDDDDDDLEDDDEEDDWVLIGGENKPPKVANEEDKQPVILVAPGGEQGEEEDESQSGCVVEEEDTDESKDECKEEGLFWENKLIEHPSMSVYIDLATSLNNGVTSCISLASIAPSAHPGESVIVLEHVDSSDSDDEGMDIVDSMELVPPPPQVVVVTPKLVKSDKKSTTSANPPHHQAPVQNGKRKKGHYPCSSSNTGNMPRRHLRNSGGPKAFQAINSWGSSSPSGGTSPDHPSSSSEIPKRKSRSQGINGCSTSSTTTSSPPTQASACGIGMVGATPTLGHHSSNMLNKNMKLLELFPVGKERSRKASPPSKNFATARGHFLQEGTRRSDMQNYTKHSHVNNDRRSAQQRRSVQKVAAAGGRGK